MTLRSISIATAIPPVWTMLSRTPSAVLSQTPRLSPRILSPQRRAISTYGYTQSKALIYSSHGEPSSVLQLHTHSISPPHSNLLTLRTLAAPLNPADINQIQGTYASLPPLTTALGTSQPAAVPGNEGVFEVLSTGSSARSVQKGDWVIPRRTGLGTWRTHLQVPENAVLRVEKDGLQPVHAATVTVNPVTAWRLLTDFAPLTPGKDWFVQNGANSGVGRAALQLARKWGLANIAVVRDRPGAEGDALRAELQALGATHVVTEEEAQSRDFGHRVREWTASTSGELKLALNCVGGKPAIALARNLAPGGCLVTYGAMSRQPLTLPSGLLIFRNIRFEGFWVSKWGDAHPEEKRKCVEEVLSMVRAGEFVMGPTVDVPWSWETGCEELVSAVQGTLEGFRRGKGVFVFGES